MTLEAVCTVVLAASVLGESLTAGQALGGACVLAATVVVAGTRAPAARATPPQGRRRAGRERVPPAPGCAGELS
jgi:hypothetical protein